MLIFIFLFFSFSIKKRVFCFDDLINCTPSDLPELPQDAEYYPFLTKNFVEDGLFGTTVESIAYVVFGKNAFVNATERTKVMNGESNQLTEINFYSPFEGIEVTIYFAGIGVTNLVCYNFTRVAATMYSDLFAIGWPIYFYTTKFFFFEDAYITNPENLTVQIASDYYYPLKDFDKIFPMQFTDDSYFNFLVDMDEVEDFTILLSRTEHTVCGVSIPIIRNFLYGDEHKIWFVYSKNSKYEHIKIESDTTNTVTVHSVFYFGILYNEEKYEFNIPTRDIVFEVGETFIDRSFDKSFTFEFMLISPYLQISFDFLENTEYLKYKIYDADYKVIATYPIEENFFILTNEKFEENVLLYDSYLFNDQNELDQLFEKFGVVYNLYIYYDIDLELDLSKINIDNELQIIIHGNGQNSVLTIIDSPKCNFSITSYNSVITFLPTKVYTIKEPVLYESTITNPEVIVVYRVYCQYTALSSCKVPSDETAYIQVYYPNDFVPIFNLTYMNDHQIQLVSSTSTYSFDFGPGYNIETTNIIIEYNFSNFPLSSVQKTINFGKESSVTKIPDLTLKIVNSSENVVITFLDSFQEPLADFFNLTVLSKLLNLYTLDLPLWVNYLSKNFDDSSEIYDRCPIENDNLIVCMTGTICTGLRIPSANSFIYISNIFTLDLDLVDIKTRVIRSNSYYNTIYFIYGPILLSGDTSIYDIDTFEKAGLSSVTGTIYFTTENSFDDITINYNENSVNKANTWIVDNLHMITQNSWEIPNLYMINGGYVASLGIKSTNIEIDAQSIEFLYSITAKNITIRHTISSLSTIVIGDNSLIIDSYSSGVIPLEENPTITILISQNENYTNGTSYLYISPKESEPLNIDFKFENILNLVYVIFDDQWSQVNKSSTYSFRSLSPLSVSITNLIDPIIMTHTNYERTIIFDEFPYTTIKKVKMCYSPDSLFCQQFYYSYDTITSFKLVFDNNSFLNNIQSINSKIDEFYIYTDNSLVLDFDSFGHVPNHLHFEGKEKITIELISTANQNISKFSIKNCIVKTDNSDSIIPFNEINLNSAEFYATVSAYTLYSSIFDYKFLEGTCAYITLNYTFKDTEMLKNSKYINANNLYHLSKNEPRNKLLDDISNNSLTYEISLMKDKILVDSHNVDLKPLNSQMTKYRLSFTKTSILIISIQSIPIFDTLEIILEFAALPSGFFDNRVLWIDFDETWNNYENLKTITLNIEALFTNCYYYQQNVPSCVFLNSTSLTAVNNGGSQDMQTLLPSSTTHEIIIVCVLIAVMLIVIIIIGMIFVLRQKKYKMLIQEESSSNEIES